MSARSAWVWGNASWREAVRVREPFVDVEHLLLGLAAVGGPAARMLARHGFTLAGGRRAALAAHVGALASLGVEVDALPPVAPVPSVDLHPRASGHAPMAPRAERLRKTLRRSSTERDYLAALLAEPSAAVREVLVSADVDVDALERDLTAATDWRTPAPVRVASSPPPRPGRHHSSLRLEHWVSAPAPLVHRVASDLTGAGWWPPSPDGRYRTVDGRGECRTSTDGSGEVDMVLTRAAPERVRWEMWAGQRFFGSHTLDLSPQEGGTAVGYTRELVTFRHSGALIMRSVRFATGLGMYTRVQDLSLACADLIAGDW